MAEQDEQLNEMDPHDRRRFFRAGLSRLLRPVAGFIEKKLPILPYVGERMLRPPGAIEERDFLETCFWCGSCVDACPANSIVAIASSDERLNGTPQVDPAVQACVICDELACMKACPSGALKLVDRFEIRMGLAVVDYEVCVRTAGEDCRICVERCPLGETAIGIDDEGRVVVVDPGATGRGCTGCGVCEQYCPTRPMRAIRIDAV